MTLTPSHTSLALFCRVVDNYGDIGICWRLARQWRHEHGIAVTLWVDNLHSFRRLCPQVDPRAPAQNIEGVAVRHWTGQDGSFTPEQVADIVIEFFAVDIPPGYIQAMARRAPQPVWLNLEGLTAEEWVEGCHMLPSRHPRLPLTKHFFFPGFTPNTGGLPREAGLARQREQFEAAPFLAQLGLAPAERAALKVSLFCYPQAPVAALFKAWEEGAHAVCCLVPDGVAGPQVEEFLAGARGVRTRGALTVRVLPFLPQPDYDRLLWACDLNFVRGEDSFVRAQWACQPFVWHIYPQDEDLHHKKLRAFLQRYAQDLDSLAAFSLCWNGVPGVEPDWPQLWQRLRTGMPVMATRAHAWQAQMAQHGDLAGNLLKFAAALSLSDGKTQV